MSNSILTKEQAYAFLELPVGKHQHSAACHPSGRVAINTEKDRKGPKRTEKTPKRTEKTPKRTEKTPKRTLVITITIHAHD